MQSRKQTPPLRGMFTACTLKLLKKWQDFAAAY